MLRRKPLLIGILTIAGFVFGFIFLLKSCLARYDERFMIAPALVFKDHDKTVVFSIVEFQKTTSYSQKGGMTHKTVSASYYVQINDGNSSALIKDKKIKSHRQVRNFPVETIGASGTTAWTFIGELMAFDAFTLEVKADTKILEAKNPSLAGRFPSERRYYQFDQDAGLIRITATDGTRWKLDPASLLMTPDNTGSSSSEVKSQLDQIAARQQRIDAMTDSLWEVKSHQPATAYAAKQISYTDYQASLRAYYEGRKVLQAERDSLDQIRSRLSKMERNEDDRRRAIEQLNRTSISYSQIKSNQDTSNQVWYGMYGNEEITSLYDRVSYQPAYNETMRRALLKSNYSLSKYGEQLINKNSMAHLSEPSFLDGGFLLDKRSAIPVHINTGNGSYSFLVVHKEKIGNDGIILISRMNQAGKVEWTFHTGLSNWNDWIITPDRLYVFGVDNKKLGSSETNLLISIGLDNGKVSRFDYFKKKTVE